MEEKQWFLFKNGSFHDTNIYHNKIEVPQEKAAETRLAQLALYYPLIFQTPALISEALSEHEIALYTIPELKKTIISNKLDSTILLGNGEAIVKGEQYKPLDWFELKKRRGY